MHQSVIAQLRCPVCADPLNPAVRALRCPRGHSFDQAKQGYLDLSAGRITHAGDSAAMLDARQRLLDAGHLDVVADGVLAALRGALRPYTGGLLVEVGAGTGHYLARALDAWPALDGLAVDVSTAALRRAARAHPRLMAIRADVWRGLPIASESAVAILDVFAPRSGAEFARILRPDGTLVVVTPTAEHLSELITAVGLLGVDPDKAARLDASLNPWFFCESARRTERLVQLSHADCRAVAMMGPSARHLDQAILTALVAALPEPFEVTVAASVSTWHLAPGRPDAGTPGRRTGLSPELTS